jgi:hypothetical protein
VFGDGPDGGREATFTGKTGTFPSSSDPWDGYVVVQAKFCQRPTGKTQEDGKWALGELRKELDAFAARGTKRKKPQYYIFVTNVVLSPKQDAGSKDKAAGLISRYRRSLGLKDYRVWDFDQLCRFLDADQAVRTAYRAWITAGDVFARLATALESKCPEFKKVMVNYLQKELLEDHYSKLEQAGHSPENRVPLERVFVDLPVFGERRPEAPKEGEDGNPLPQGFLAAVLQASAFCLAAGSNTIVHSDRSGQERGTSLEPGRYVLIGGPGQGKSTLAQFLCQTHRAQLLRTASGLDVDARSVIDSIAEQCARQGVQLDLARRFPVRIELARFAKALATEGKGKVASVLAYLRDRIKERTDYEVSADHLRTWLHEYPWLVILDGLDEVPASSNRAQVLAATNDFLVDIATCEADVLLIATTRPQGYNAEFSPERYRHLWLAPLSIPRAIHYGETLVELTYRGDSQRRAEVLNRLWDAAKVEATARLMESPLQVTIMARLLAQIAKPPQERYKLFQQYYKVIYRREMERGVTQLSQLLRDFETDIDAIHYHTGLLLQIESERTQHTDATLSVGEFKQIVQHRLDQEGHSEDTRRKMTEAIITCATERLVFLVPSQSERVGFEIRSLQEFMAAEALMDGGDRIVTSRIRKIATVPFWQNVLLFAAGKCFAERQWLRDSVSEICGEMNDDPSDQLGHAVLAGSHLALSLLEDGPARRQPAYSHSLARRALGLLVLPPNEAHDRLADVYEPAFETVYREEMQERMRSQPIHSRLSTWRVLLRLLRRESAGWAAQFMEANWPKDRGTQEHILREFDPLGDAWLWGKYQDGFFELPLLTDAHMFARIKQDRPEAPQRRLHRSVETALRMEAMWWEGMRIKAPALKLIEDFHITAGATGIGAAREELACLADMACVHPHWMPLKEGARFAAEATSRSLADALERLAEHLPLSPKPVYIRRLPWPLAACLQSADDREGLRGLAGRVRAGALGDASDWAAAERRWADKGITIEDLTHMTDERWPIGDDVADKGFPFACTLFGWEGHASPGKALPELWSLLPGAKARMAFAPLVLHYFSHVFSGGAAKWIDRNLLAAKRLLCEVIEAIEPPVFLPYEVLLTIHEMWREGDGEVDIFDALGRKMTSRMGYGRGAFYVYGDRSPDTIAEITMTLTAAVERDVSLRGAVTILTMFASESPIVRIPSNLALLRRSSEPETALAGLLLSLCQQPAFGASHVALVDALLQEWGDDTHALARFLDCSVAQFGDQPHGQSVFLRFWDRVEEKNVRAKQRALRVMMDLLNRRVTSLQELAVWKQLSLPEGLHEVLSPQVG